MMQVGAIKHKKKPDHVIKLALFSFGFFVVVVARGSNALTTRHIFQSTVREKQSVVKLKPVLIF